MLTRFVRTQLIIFSIASLIGVLVMVFVYLQAPTLLGIGRITVTVELPRSGGLYRFSNVTYRGVQIGKVTDIKVVDGNRVETTVSLAESVKVPADSQAVVRSVSAVGEQFIDLQPPNESGPYLQDGSVIAMAHTAVPQQVGPMLDQVSSLVASIPKDRLSDLLGESFKAFNGAGEDFGSLLDSSSRITNDLNGVAGQSRSLIDQGAPLLDTQVASSDALRVWARALAGVTGQLVSDDPQVRTLLQTGPGFADEAARLLQQVKPTLPVLLANLTTIGQVGVTYHASLEQLLVLLPPSIAVAQASSPRNNATGQPLGDFSLSLGDPPACTVGFLPPSQWRSPTDESDIDTPDGLYCKLPQDSPIAVRGARNYPCMGHPGKRAPTVQICDSDQPFVPLAMRQHVTGPYPIDPSATAQGVPPDDRLTFQDHIYGPLNGTPRPPDPVPAPAAGPPGPDQSSPPANAPEGQQSPGQSSPAPPSDGPTAQIPGGQPAVAPSSFDTGAPGAGPSVAVVKYDPRTGAYMGPDGHMYAQTDLASTPHQRSWTDLVYSP